MYVGQIAQITNREDWVSDVFQLTDDDTGEIINIANPDVGFACSVYIKDAHGCILVMIDLSSGVIVADADDGPGIQWVIRHSSLARLCAGTYTCGVKVTLNGIVGDLIIGTIAIMDGL